MILGIDTDVLVAWAMTGAPRHETARRIFAAEVQDRGGLLGLTPQVLHEFLHITTDPRRFEAPLKMRDALQLARSLWDAEEVVQILPTPEVLRRTLNLIESLRLGRKRILDTALAATLESVGVRRLATFNPGDFQIFPFLEIEDIPAEP